MKKFAVKTYYLKKNNGNGPGSHPLRFVFLTDLHSVDIGGENRFLLTEIRKFHPDLVLCGGDMIVGKPDQDPKTALHLMAEIRKEYPVIHALGNHEYRGKIYPDVYGSLYEDYHKGLEKLGVILLDNEKVSLTFSGFPVTVYGLTISREYYQRFSRRRLPSAVISELLGEPEREGLSVLLAHNPQHMQAYFDWGADLTLCGHYHGGIIRVGKHRGLISPDFRLFPREAAGLFEKNGRQVIVSAGLGEHTLPLRIHNPRELTAVTVAAGNGRGF